MSTRTRRLRRCQLAVPASNEAMMQKAAASAADYVFLDLEDATARSAKPAARSQVVRALNTHDWGKKTRCVRVNDLTTPYWLDDVIEVVSGAQANLDVIMLTKVMRASDVLIFDAVLTQLERKFSLKKSIGLDLLIEEVEALQNVEEIARSTPRLEAMVIGLGDYSASHGLDIMGQINQGTYPGDLFHHMRFRTVMAGRAAGVDVIDGPYPAFRNPDGFRRECVMARMIGCVGKWAIHPSQIAIANEVFTPNPAVVANARRISASYAESESRGEGAVVIDGMMADAATVRLLRNTLDMAELIGM